MSDIAWGQGPQDGQREDVLQAAARRWAEGRLLAFPTETVYGLGARADDDAAVAAIFQAKGRPADHPLIVHVAGVEAVERVAQGVSEAAWALMAKAWPGPVTLILPRRPGVAGAAAGGQATVGVRCPSHPTAQALLKAAHAQGVWGVAAPSANRFGRVSPTRADHVWTEFEGTVPVVDGGACEVGIESAIVDCSREPARMLRPGTLCAEALARLWGRPVAPADAQAPKVSGSLESHYAPRSAVRLWSAGELAQRLAAHRDAGAGLRVALYSPHPHAAADVHRLQPQEPLAAARDLFVALRELDAGLQGLGGGEIWIQAPPPQAEWDGVRDRLTRAAAAA